MFRLAITFQVTQIVKHPLLPVSSPSRATQEGPVPCKCSIAHANEAHDLPARMAAWGECADACSCDGVDIAALKLKLAAEWLDVNDTQLTPQQRGAVLHIASHKVAQPLILYGGMPPAVLMVYHNRY